MKAKKVKIKTKGKENKKVVSSRLRTYYAEYEISGYATAYIKASNKKEAVEKAKSLIDYDLDVDAVTDCNLISIERQ